MTDNPDEQPVGLAYFPCAHIPAERLKRRADRVAAGGRVLMDGGKAVGVYWPRALSDDELRKLTEPDE